MSTRLREKQEKIEQILECLIEESARGTPIIVEGKKDVETLRALGVEGEIITAKTGGKSRLDLISEIEKAGKQEVILLLDFDRRGKEWIAILRCNLEKAKIKANITFWRDLLRLVGRELKDVEGLAAYTETLNRKLWNMNRDLISAVLQRIHHYQISTQHSPRALSAQMFDHQRKL